MQKCTFFFKSEETQTKSHKKIASNLNDNQNDRKNIFSREKRNLKIEVSYSLIFFLK